MQPETHAEKYSGFLDGLTAYLAKATTPAKKKRKGSEFSPLLKWREQPTGEPLTSNWRTAANDNRAQAADADQEEDVYEKEMIREIVPSTSQIKREAAKAKYREIPAFAMLDHKKGDPKRRTERYPIGGDVEFGTHVDDNGKKHKVVVRIGKMRFSDGTQTEKTMLRVDAGKVIEANVRMPVGAMLGTRERLRKEKGGTAVWGASNQVWSAMLNRPQPAQKLKLGPLRRGRSIGRDEAAKMLAEAYANTPVLPPVTRCPPGLPYRPDRIADMFLAGKKSTCAGGGAPSWQDTASALVVAAEWRLARAELSPEDTAVLDAAMTAKNYGDIGAVVGVSHKAGKRRLKASNDNLDVIIKKFAA